MKRGNANSLSLLRLVRMMGPRWSMHEVCITVHLTVGYGME